MSTLLGQPGDFAAPPSGQGPAITTAAPYYPALENPRNAGSAVPADASDQGKRDAEKWRLADDEANCEVLRVQWRGITKSLSAITEELRERAARGEELSADESSVVQHARIIEGLQQEIPEFLNSYRGPAVQVKEIGDTPRVYVAAVACLRALDSTVSEKSLAAYLEGVQQVESLSMAEIWALKPALQIALLEELSSEAAALGDEPRRRASSGDSTDSARSSPVRKTLHSLRVILDISWERFFERNNAVDQILRRDPAAAYARMDNVSRQLYRDAVAEMAKLSPHDEAEVARQAIYLSLRAKDQASETDLPASRRRTHVGYYLIAEGRETLQRRLEYRPSLRQRVLNAILKWPEAYYIFSVEFTTLALVVLLIGRFGVVIPWIVGLLLLIPASHAAIDIVNSRTSTWVPPRRLAKMDFAEGVPEDCKTLVAVPCLLLSAAEVRRNIEALEVRYLGNRDAHIHYALVTDSPDADQRFDKHDELIGLCSTLIELLNLRYGNDRQGSFIHLHRHRVYNPSEGTWMGWERKRGKLMDLNDLLLGNADSFPVKAGDLSALSSVRYVITLDSDTKLPPGTARQLVGALAHPVNQAVIDPAANTVVEGYGILQPRVSISIESSRHSRLASIYSGGTAFDIYSHAASDIYQDLFGEGSFTGKGIYEVATVQRVLRRRFPTNALLSHDLIEGAYARAGLVSDVVVVDDYPSHFSAYSRRLHRWVRGDWQIMRWLLPRVPDFYGNKVENPLNFISRWKIFDNLRRSVNDIGLFLLLVLGWTVLPGGPVYWTLVTMALFLMPTYTRLLFSLLNVGRHPNWGGFLRERANDLLTGHLQVFVMVVFLPHQALIMADAIIRTIARLTFTHSNLLEWETAAEAEVGRKRTPVETYLRLTPWIAIAIALLLAMVRPHALLVASPILALWLVEDFFTEWVNRRLVAQVARLIPARERFLRLLALRTWRYFREFSTTENRWLIPDNVQEDPPNVAARLSPTNLGLLLNGQLAALEMGFLTLEEYAERVERTFQTMRHLPKHRGHFYNWYDTQSGQPISPLFVSTVDSGNLAACLWTLKQSFRGFGNEPLLPRNLWRGLHDHFELLAEVSEESQPAPEALSILSELTACIKTLTLDTSRWLDNIPYLEQQIRYVEHVLRSGRRNRRPTRPVAADLEWWLAEAALRLRKIHEHVENFMPWVLPQYSFLGDLPNSVGKLSLASLPATLRKVEDRMAEIQANPQASDAERTAARSLSGKLATSLQRVAELMPSLERLAEEADRLVEEMDFRFLYNAQRKMFAIGYDVSAGTLTAAHYDLLASEARLAVFIAIAKGEVGKDAWFLLGRQHTSAGRKRVLLSWSGTMFEYLMPGLWLRSLPDTVMHHSMHGAVHCQRSYARENGVPWGFSEAAFSARDPQGTYRYQAFGLPALALDTDAPGNLVVSAYSNCLALAVEAEAAVENLEALREMGCLGSLGFYESCDFSPAQDTEGKRFEIVCCWMAHHQGMSLVAISNFLNQSSNQKWFNKEPRVKAAQLFLQERISLSAPVKPKLQHALEKNRTQGGRDVLHSRLEHSATQHAFE